MTPSNNISSCLPPLPTPCHSLPLLASLSLLIPFSPLQTDDTVGDVDFLVPTANGGLTLVPIECKRKMPNPRSLDSYNIELGSHKKVPLSTVFFFFYVECLLILFCASMFACM